MDDLGIYTDIKELDKKSPWDNRHKMYSAKCKKCGRTVERTLYDLRHFNKVCQHKKFGNYILSNDKPKGFLSDKYNARVYDLWKHMIMRTTPEFWEKYPTYFGTTVSEEWRDFMTFYEDIKSLEGYEMWRDGYGQRIMLDKDIKGNGSKHYSKETCCFITHAQSNRDVIARNPQNLEKLHSAAKQKAMEQATPVRAINKITQEVKEFQSLHECCDILGLNFRNIWMCLSSEDKYKSHKSCGGWVFEYID